MKDICWQCQYWTKDKKHGKYRCYTHICPAYMRDHNEIKEKK
jgi:hypothetical protein